MWAQLITTKVKPDRLDGLRAIAERLQSIEQSDSGLLRSTLMVDRADPTNAHLLVVFKSEEHARAREADPRRAAGLEEIRGLMAEVLDGPPVFTDLDVAFESSYP
jgi:quinol monooxygenase YgiN